MFDSRAVHANLHARCVSAMASQFHDDDDDDDEG